VRFGRSFEDANCLGYKPSVRAAHAIATNGIAIKLWPERALEKDTLSLLRGSDLALPPCQQINVLRAFAAAISHSWNDR
jgi:hypothetical protein